MLPKSQETNDFSAERAVNKPLPIFSFVALDEIDRLLGSTGGLTKKTEIGAEVTLQGYSIVPLSPSGVRTVRLRGEANDLSTEP